jgi:hypothetical protein
MVKKGANHEKGYRIDGDGFVIKPNCGDRPGYGL